jgi:hypothetical protein
MILLAALAMKISDNRMRPTGAKYRIGEVCMATFST